MGAQEISGEESRVSETDLKEIFQGCRETEVDTINKGTRLFPGSRKEKSK